MYLVLFIAGFLILNCLVFFLFKEKSVAEHDTNKLCALYKDKTDFNNRNKNVKKGMLLFKKRMSIREKRKFIEYKRRQDLNLERIQLENKLKILNYISDFELYLAQNKIDENKFNKMKIFLDLKVSTQKSVLESAERISGLCVNY
jgi:hypothetical protein